jgi:hypothetical protein
MKSIPQKYKNLSTTEGFGSVWSIGWAASTTDIFCPPKVP